MSQVAFIESQPCFRIQLHAVESTKERAVVHPPFSGDFIGYHTGIDGIHGSGIIGFDNTAYLCPRTFGGVGFSKSDIRSLASESGDTIVETVFVFVGNDIGGPDIGCSFSIGMFPHPLHSFFRNFGKCPSQKLPVYEVFGTTHLNVSQGHPLFFGFLSVFTEDGVGRIHIIIVAQLSAGRVVYVVCSPLEVIFHFGY